MRSVDPNPKMNTTRRGNQKNNSNSLIQRHNTSYSATYPMIKSEDIKCPTCQHRMNLSRNSTSSRSPLLLPCGHMTCTSCEQIYSYKPCVYCPNICDDKNIRNNLPYNIYVTGLVCMNSSTPHKDVDISFHSQSSISRADKIEAVKSNLLESILTNFCPNHTTQVADYFCNTCGIEYCSHCIIIFHKDHEIISQTGRNEELMPGFHAAYEELQRTIEQIDQRYKDIAGKVLNSNILKEIQRIDSKITNHFIYLHGVLQNLEIQLKNKLVKYQDSLKQQMVAYEKIFSIEVEKLTAIARICEKVEPNNDKLNLRELTEKVKQLTKSSCHVMLENVYDETIRIVIDDDVFVKINEHIQLHVPDISKFKLVTGDDLPQKSNLLQLMPPNPERSLNGTIDSNDSLAVVQKSAITQNSLAIISNSSTVASNSLAVVPVSRNNFMNKSICDEISPIVIDDNLDPVKVVHVKDPTQFYVQKVSTSKLLDNIQAEIEKYVEDNTNVSTDVQINRIYIVQSLSDLKWYRGKITKILDDNNNSETSETNYEVFFIDYGTTESEITPNRIRNGHSKFTLHAGLALHCTLLEIEPKNSEWKEDAIKNFKNMVTQDTLYMKILNNGNSVYSVDLRTKQNLSIREWLIDTGLSKTLRYCKLERMNPQSAHQFYYESLAIDKYTSVIISYVESPDCIYVQKAHNEDFEEKMSSFCKEFSKLVKNTDLNVLKPDYGCTVAYKDAPYWHRGYVTEINEAESKLTVFLVDNGKTITVGYHEVKHLPSRFCAWNAQAIEIALNNIKPVGNSWSVKATDYLKSHLSGKRAHVMTYEKTNKKFLTNIFLQNININNCLIEMNLGQATGSTNSTALCLKNSKPSSSLQLSLMNKLYENSKPMNRGILALKNKGSRQILESIDPFKVQVIIQKVITPDAIYVSEATINEEYENMIVEMQKFYESHECNSNCKLLPHNYYCVYSRKDKKYLRAEFLEILESDSTQAKMSLVDLSEIENIPVDNIQALNSNFFKIPRNMFKIKLAGIRPCGGTSTWQSSSCEKLNEIINNNGDMKYYVTSILQNTPADDDSILVDLFIRRNVQVGPIEPNRKETLSVARCLVEAGLAIPIRGYVENADRQLGIELMEKLQLHSASIGTVKPCSIENTISINESVFHGETMGTEDDNFVENVNENPKVFNNWLPNNYLLKKTFNAVFTYLDYDCDAYFHVNSKKYLATVQYITDTLSKHYLKGRFKIHYKWKKGDLCNVNYHLDKRWYRGRVEKILNNQFLNILFVDYGNIERCSVYDVDKEVILQDIPVQCIKAKIFGLKPINKKWKESDLDILHNLIVSKCCKVSVVQKSNPLIIAIWINENSNLYPLPLYIKNKTQVPCIAEDITKFYSSDDDLEDIDVASEFDTSAQSPLQVTVLHKNHFKDLISQDKDFNNSTFFDNSSNDIETTFTNSRSIDTLNNNVIQNIEMTLVHQDNLSTTASDSGSVFSKSSSNIMQSIIQNEDRRINLLNNNYESRDDLDSITTEIMNNELMDANLVSSTPINNCLYYQLTKDNSYYIEFEKYGITSFEMGIGEAFSEIEMSGFIIASLSKELNGWIDSFNALQKQIQSEAENQPLFSIDSDQFCIAKFHDGLWYRAYVLKIDLDSGKVLLEFIDYGNRINSFINADVRTMKDEWFRIPWMSFHFKLFNVKVVTDQVEELQRAFVDSLGAVNRYTGVIRKYKPELELELYMDRECKHLAYRSLLDSNLLDVIN